ncbi:glycoside hydrolase superfamily [Kalaharituber pfeilii]|nr:glycoside hydrolase superfamily [Kalaharituber pfeilii]
MPQPNPKGNRTPHPLHRSIPGDLIKAGAIEDPHVGVNEREVQWLHDRGVAGEWQDDIATGQAKVEFVCEGLDTFATIGAGQKNELGIVPMRIGNKIMQDNGGPRVTWNAHYCRNFVRKAQYHYTLHFKGLIEIENPELWYPVGCGEPNLYKVEYILKSGDHVNCLPILIGGSSWIPADTFRSRISKERLTKLIKTFACKIGNQNMLRVWGGGIYESNDFYDICDELGIMVWQDGVGGFNGDGNEQSDGEKLGRIIYWPGSPWGGDGSGDRTIGDDPEFHPQGSPANAIKEHSFEKRFMAYLGENLWVNFHSYEEYVHISQLLQSEAIGYAYRGWGRLWGGNTKTKEVGRLCGGVLVWQLNGVWPVTSWSLVDSFLRPKPAHYAIARVLDDITVGVHRETWPDRPNGKVEALVTNKTTKAAMTGGQFAIHSTPHIFPPRKSEVIVWIANKTLESFKLKDKGFELTISYVDVCSGKVETVSL